MNDHHWKDEKSRLGEDIALALIMLVMLAALAWFGTELRPYL